ncbi:hypothetical protein Bca4012_049061 [Brassica carinata]
MFNERNIWSRRRPSTNRPEKYKKLRDMERCARQARFNRSWRKKKSSLATTNSTMPCLDAPLVKKMSSLTTTSTMPVLMLL